MVLIKGKPNPELPDHMNFRAHGILLSLHVRQGIYEQTVPLVDEICKRVSVLRKSIEEAGLYMNKFENTWGYLAEVNIWLFDTLKQNKLVHRYRNSRNKDGWIKRLDPLNEYYLTVSFLTTRDEKDLPPGKVRSMIVWLHHAEEQAPLGNLAYVSEHFVF